MLNGAHGRYARLISSAGVVLALVATSWAVAARQGKWCQGTVDVGAMIDENARTPCRPR